MLEQVEDGQFIQDLKMNVLQAIQYITKSWNEVTVNTIKNCWNHVKILSNAISEDIYDDDLMLDDDLNKAIEALHLPNMMRIKEFLTIPEENIVYEIPNTSAEFADIFKNGPINHPDEVDDSSEIEIICVKEALQNLKSLNLYLLQQENAGEHIKLVDKIEKFVKKEQINSMQQTTIDQYFG